MHINQFISNIFHKSLHNLFSELCNLVRNLSFLLCVALMAGRMSDRTFNTAVSVEGAVSSYATNHLRNFDRTDRLLSEL